MVEKVMNEKYKATKNGDCNAEASVVMNVSNSKTTISIEKMNVEVRNSADDVSTG